MGTSRTTKTAAAAALILAIPGIAGSQDAGEADTGGLGVELGVSSSLRLDDNYNLEVGGSGGLASIWDTTLSLAVTSETRTQSLRFTGAGVLRFADLPTKTITGFEDPNLQLSYTRLGTDSRLTLDAGYRFVDREFLDPFAEDTDPEDLINDAGTLTTTSARLTFETGIDRPLGFLVTAGRDDRNYQDTTDPDLFDNTTDDVSFTARMRVTPTGQLSLNAGREWYDADDATQTERETTDLSIGWAQEVSQSLTLNAAIGYTDIETDELGIITTESGATGSIALDQALPNGNATASLDLSQTINGSRTSLTFGRSFELPRGALAATLGLTRGETGSTDWIASLDYTQQGKLDLFNVSLDRSAETNGDDEDIIFTRFGVNYGREIDTVSRFDIGFDYSRSEDGGAGSAPTIDSASVRAAYTRELTSDWSLEGGVLFRYVDDSSEADSAESSAVFLTIDRTFSFRP